MKRNYILGLIFLVLGTQMACSPFKEPEFRGVQNMSVTAKGDNTIVEGEAIMFNPNKRKLTLYEMDLDVNVNNANVGNILDTTQVALPPNDVFYVPVQITIPTKILMGNLISSFFNAADSKKLEVQYRGHVRMKAMGFKFKLPINAKSNIKLKL